MREVKAIKINAADFAPYGTFCNMTEPEGYPLQGEIHKFYPDRISGTCMGTMAFSPIAVRKDERIIRTCQGIYCSQRTYGKDQCSNLAFVSSSCK